MATNISYTHLKFYDTIIISELVQLRPDPQASKSPLIISSPDFSTLRIIPFINNGDWKVIQEYRDKSSLKGLSSLGGLWTLLGNCFTLVFGISIMRFLFRMCYDPFTCKNTTDLDIFRLQASLYFWDNLSHPTFPRARQLEQGIPNRYRKTQECSGLHCFHG